MQKNPIPVVILAGGLGTRLREETEFKPKPMVAVGGKPILWHIMKTYAHYGFYRFIICLGYKGEMIKDYFLNYRLNGADFTVNTQTGAVLEHTKSSEEWEVTLVDTGFDCMTGGRIARVSRYIDTPLFMLTYGDGLANVNIQSLLDFHTKHKRLATLTSVKAPSRFGNLALTGTQVTSFLEKDAHFEDWINGGYFVLQREALSYLTEDKNCVFEQQPLKNMALDNQLMAYQHNGFWQCMDTIREHQKLEELWAQGAPWKVWDDTSLFDAATKSNFEKAAQPPGQIAVQRA